MKFSIAIFYILFVFSAVSLSAQDPQWLAKMKQVKLLSHTYDDVLKILGKPSDDTEEKSLIETFDFKQGEMTVLFASGQCLVTPYSDGKPLGWKVPEHTVIEAEFSFEKHLKPKNLKIDLDGFTRTPVKQSPDLTPDDNRRASFLFEWSNDDLGIDLFEEYGKISQVTFRPSKQFDYLDCKKQ